MYAQWCEQKRFLAGRWTGVPQRTHPDVLIPIPSERRVSGRCQIDQGVPFTAGRQDTTVDLVPRSEATMPVAANSGGACVHYKDRRAPAGAKEDHFRVRPTRIAVPVAQRGECEVVADAPVLGEYSPHERVGGARRPAAGRGVPAQHHGGDPRVPRARRERREHAEQEANEIHVRAPAPGAPRRSGGCRRRRRQAMRATG